MQCNVILCGAALHQRFLFWEWFFLCLPDFDSIWYFLINLEKWPGKCSYWLLFERATWLLVLPNSNDQTSTNAKSEMLHIQEWFLQCLSLCKSSPHPLANSLVVEYLSSSLSNVLVLPFDEVFWFWFWTNLVWLFTKFCQIWWGLSKAGTFLKSN